jgi:DNA polymerase III alpha subunit
LSKLSHAAHLQNVFNLVTFRLRLAVREMAEALDYPLFLIAHVTKQLPSVSACRVREHRDEIAAVLGESPLLEALLCLVKRLPSCPRHLSLHSGGMILSRQPLRYLSLIQHSANSVRQIQFAKDDVEKLGLIKFDVLGLRMLSVIAESAQLHQADTADVVDVDNLPLDDPATYELIRQGEP